MSARRRFQLALALLERTLQTALQALQFHNLFLDSHQLLVQKFFNVRACRHVIRAKNQQFADLVQRKPQFLSLADKFEGFNIAKTEEAEPAFCARRSLQQSLLLVKADRVSAEAGLLGNLADSGCLA